MSYVICLARGRLGSYAGMCSEDRLMRVFGYTIFFSLRVEKLTRCCTDFSYTFLLDALTFGIYVIHVASA